MHENINKDAVDEGDYHMAVRLRFSHNGKEYDLERHTQWSKRPVSDAGMEQRVDLRIDRQIQSPGEVQRTIRDILHPNISQFYLFDGEMIREFEEKLSNDRRQAHFVREAIEQVLGLPALTLAVTDLEVLSSATEKEMNKQLKKEKTHERVSEELEAIASALATAKADVERHTELEVELEAERRDLEATQRQLAEVSGILRERDVLQEEMKRDREELANLEASLREAIAERWWLPSSRLIDDWLERSEAARSRYLDHQVQVRQMTEQIRKLEDAIARDHCPTCGQPIPAADLGELVSEVAALKEKLAELDGESDNLPATSDPGLLRVFKDPQEAYIREQSERAGRLKMDLHKRSTRIRRLEGSIRESDASDAAQNQRDLDTVIEKLATVREALETAKRTKEALEAQQKQKRGEIKVLPGVAGRLKSRLAMLDGLTRIFRQAIDEFRDSVRASVESSASETFGIFTTEAEFSGVQIDDGYALTILDRNGEPVAPSAGAQQVLALALIGGLNAAAVREGPLVIDTPFARFDLLHRENIVRNLHHLGTQIVLLVQPGEFERDHYLEMAGSSVAREYTVERVNDQRSRVLPGYVPDALVV